MLHKDKLGEHAAHFPHDDEGHIPEPGDHWANMKFQLGPNSPFEEGISAEERARRTEYLDKVWWPAILEHAKEGRAKLRLLPDGSPIQHWRDEVMPEPTPQHGYHMS